MRRLLWLALVAGTACNEISRAVPGPTDSFYKPAGIGVYAGRLVVASSNDDLLYDSATGGSVIAVDPADASDPARPPLVGGFNIESFAGQLAIADPAVCPIGGALALVPVRGADVLYRVALAANGAPSCGAGCAVPLGGTGSFADAFAVGLACATTPAPFARVYVGHLRGADSAAWVSEIDLLTDAVRSHSFGVGQMRGFAFDAARKRLYAAETGQGIRWIDLANDCQFDLEPGEGGCYPGLAALPTGLEPGAIALGRAGQGEGQRLYVLARVVDSQAAAGWGVRAGDADGVLLVTELVENLFGTTELRLLKEPISVGYGPVAVAVLPSRGATRGDVVAALTADDAVLLLHDDETDARVVIGRNGGAGDPLIPIGHPWLGTQPFGLAVDPATFAGPDGTSAAVYVGSYDEGFVSRLVVPLEDIQQVEPVAGDDFRRIFGGR